MARYVHALNDAGILLLSINTAIRGGMAILADLKRRYATLDDTRIAQREQVLGVHGPGRQALKTSRGIKPGWSPSGAADSRQTPGHKAAP